MLFLFSSFTALPDYHFDGYCFVGTDFITGAAGAEAHFKATGTRIPMQEDGCYVVLSKSGSTHELGVDHAGYKKLFYYARDGVWGASNSLVALTEHLCRNGVSLRASSRIADLALINKINDQMSTFETVVEGIQLLPSFCKIVLAETGLTVVALPVKANADYRSDLHQMIETWLRRFETLLCEPRLKVTIDLTGGLDSRVVFAFLQRALVRLGVSRLGRVYINSSAAKRWEDDHACASAICERYGRVLNGPKAKATPDRRYDDPFDLWHSLNVGVYYPIYFPRSFTDTFDVHIHGGGGENHRPFYPVVAPEQFRASCEHPAFADWRAAFLATTATLTARNPDVHPMILHYREFRSRMHGGRSPQYKTVLSPLADRHMEILSNHAQKASTGQVHFDVMENLVPGLMDLPYDDPSKSPTDQNRQALTRVDIDQQARPGRVFAQSEPKSVRRPRPRRPIDVLAEKFGDRLPETKRRMGEIDSAAQHIMAAALAAGTFDHATDASSIARVLSVDFALRL